MGTGYMTPTSTPKTVSASSAEVLAAHGHPSYRLFQNDSDTDIYLGLGTAAVVHNGVLVLKTGGKFKMSREEGSMWPGAVYAIHAGEGDKILLVTQGV